MGRIRNRNPRYAPEFLESRLSPAAMLPGFYVPVEVDTNESDDTNIVDDTLPVDVNGDPILTPIGPDPDDSVVIN